MASGTAHSTVSPPPVARERKNVQVIERQLGRARFHVKLIDLLCHAALLLVGALVYLLIAAVADHWLLPGGLGLTGRALAFVGLIALLSWFVVRFLAPLVFRAINPTYAARTIEEAQPSLKNSLINFLLLRQDRGGVREAVYEAVEQKAAADIAGVQVESAVDRTPIIRVGYVLVGVLALCAAYKILSPKDPFQTAARVALPWADIARPSRVQILEVKPGNVKVYHGHTVPITATINGTSEDSPVWLIYSTADGQTVDRKLRMKSRPGGIQFEAQLPPEDGQTPAIKPGLQQDVIYRVEAGDAATEDYRLTVVAAPTIVVQQLEYVFPAYTKKPPQKLDKQGDIHALEGTKVTIHALANQDIASAFLELDPNDSPQGAAEIVPLEFDGQRVWGTITLQMAKDGVTPWRTSYHVRFVNADGNKSEQPIRHQIDVQRDLPPEVQILAPTERRLEVPENGSRPIEVRGIDPDFGLTRLALAGDVGGKQVLREELLKDETQPPQAVARFVFRPKEYGLKAGDELIYHALAADNRTSPTSGTADPNVATTSSYLIVIVPPQEQPKNQDEPPPQGDKPPMPMNDKRQEKPEEQQPKNDQTKNEQPKEGEKSPKPMQGDSQQKDNSQQGNKSEGAKGSKGEKSGSKGGQKNDERQPNDGQKGEQQNNEDSANEGAKGQSQSGGKGQKSSGQPQQPSPTDGAAGEPSSDGQTGSKPSGNADKPAGNQTGEPGDASGDPSGASDQPSRPAHDGDAIEQINKLRQERQQQSGQPGAKRDGAGETPQDATDAREPMTGAKNGDKSDTQEDKTAAGQKTDRTQARPGSNNEKTEGAKADETKGEKGTEKGTRKTDDAQGEETGQKNNQGGKTGERPQPAAGEQPGGQKGEKTDGSDPSGAKPGEKKQPGEKGAAGSDKKQGEAGAKKEAGGKGGNPQGPMKTEKGEQPQPGEKGQKGEKKEPGMGKTGESGAGDASKDEKGTGDSQEAGRDQRKEMNPDSTQPKDSDPSPPAGSKKQSDSKGNDSGDKAGGGKKGPGQPTKQAGNDTAGENSPGDEGAGAANEKGEGPTGKKAGDQQKADGQTGAKGSEKGEGSSGEKGKGNDAGGGTPPPGAKNAKSDQAKGDEPGKGSSGHVLGGGNQDQRPPAQPGEKAVVPDSDDANLEYAKKQTELALQYLKDQEHSPDPELLDRLGWTKEELQEFVRRWNALQKAAAEDPKASHELDESLRSLGLKPATNRKRAGGTASDNARDLRDSGTRTSAPKSYRDQFDDFRKGSR